MISTTILASCFGLTALFVAGLIGFAPDYEGRRPCLFCIGVWLAQIGIALFVLAAHPQWIN